MAGIYTLNYTGSQIDNSLSSVDYKLNDAPNDGIEYIRKNGQWSAASADTEIKFVYSYSSTTNNMIFKSNVVSSYNS